MFEYFSPLINLIIFRFCFELTFYISSFIHPYSRDLMNRYVPLEQRNLFFLDGCFYALVIQPFVNNFWLNLFFNFVNSYFHFGSLFMKVAVFLPVIMLRLRRAFDDAGFPLTGQLQSDKPGEETEDTKETLSNFLYRQFVNCCVLMGAALINIPGCSSIGDSLLKWGAKKRLSIFVTHDCVKTLDKAAAWFANNMATLIKGEAILDADKLILIQIMATVQVVIKIYAGEYKQAAEHGMYVAVAQSDNLVKGLKVIPEQFRKAQMSIFNKKKVRNETIVAFLEELKQLDHKDIHYERNKKELMTKYNILHDGRHKVIREHVNAIIYTLSPENLETYMASIDFNRIVEEGKTNQVMSIFDSEKMVEFLVDYQTLESTLQSDQEDLMSQLYKALSTWIIPGANVDMCIQDLAYKNAQLNYQRNSRKDLSDKLKIFMSGVSLISWVLFSFDPFDMKANAVNIEATRICNEMDEALLNKDKVYTDKVYRDRIVAIFKKADKFSSHPQYIAIPSALKNHFEKKIKDYINLYRTALCLNSQESTRTEAAVWLVYGKSGTGKSSKVSRTVECFSQYYKDKVDDEGFPYFNKQIYNRNQMDQFWEGYFNQGTTVIDDWCQSTDPKIRNLTALELFAIVGALQYPLNMAYSGKGNIFFRSKLMLLSTNDIPVGKSDDPTNPEYLGFKAWNPQVGIICNEALERRLHLVTRAITPAASGASYAETYYIVDHCYHFPELVGKKLNHDQCASWMIKIHEKLEKNKEDIAAQAANTPFVFDDSLQGNLQSNICDIFDTKEYVKYMLKNQLYTFWNSPNLTFYMMILAAFSTSAILLAIYKYCCRPERGELDSDLKRIDFHAGMGRRAYRRAANGYTQSVNYDVPNPETIEEIPPVKSTINDSLSKTNMEVFLEGKIGQYVIGFEFVKNDKVLHTARGMYLKDKIFLVNLHFIAHNPWKADLRITWNKNNSRIIPFQAFKIAMKENQDMSTIKIDFKGNYPKPCYDLLPQTPFVVPGMPVYIGYSPYTAAYESGLIHEHRSSVSTSFTMYNHKNNDVEPVSVNFDYVPLYYNIKTQSGWSGAPIFSADASGTPKLIGIHCGLTDRTHKAFAHKLCKDFVDNMLAVHNVGTVQSLIPESEIPFEIIKKVPPPHVPLYTRIIPSFLMKFLKDSDIGYAYPNNCQKIPPYGRSVLVDGKEKSVFTLACEKFHQTFTPKCDINEESSLDYLSNLYPRTKNARVLTIDEAVNGILSMNIPSIAFSTSPGYPENLHTKGKWDLFVQYVHNGEIRHKPIERLEMEVFEILEALKNGELKECLWMDVLKDETLPIEKVRAGKRRLFSACPIAWTIVIRILFGSFMGYVQGTPAEKPVSVGINAHSREWEQLYRRLQRCDYSVIAGDFSKYDARIPKFVGEIFIKFVNSWYNDEFQDARTLVMEHIWNSTHVYGGFVYQVCDGNPSGNPMTTVYNSICNVIMCHCILTQDFGFIPGEFEIAVYGDDNIMTCIDRGKRLRVSDFTPFFLKRFGMLYTHFSKKDVDPYDTLLTIRYLSRLFVLTRGIIKAPLPIETIVESLYWYAGGDQNSVMLSSISSYCTELSHFPKETFYAYRGALEDAIRNIKPQFLPIVQSEFIPYSAYEQRMYHNSDRCVPLIEGIDVNEYVEVPLVGVLQSEVNSNFQNIDDREANEPQIFVENSMGKELTSLASTREHIQLNNSGPHSVTNIPIVTQSNLDKPVFVVRTWSSSSNSKSLIQSFNAFNLIKSDAFISKAIYGYRYIRCNILVTIKVNTTRFDSGSLVFAWLPNMAPGVRVNSLTYEQATSLQHVRVTAASAESVSMIIPFTNAFRYLSLTTGQTYGILYCFVEAPLRNSEGYARTVNMNITFSLDNAQLFMKDDLNQSLVIEKGTLQSNVIKEAYEKAKQNVIAGVKVAKENIISYATTKTFEALTQIAVHSVVGADKPTTIATGEIVKTNPNTDFLNGSGVDLSIKMAVDPVNNITRENVFSVNQDPMLLTNMLGHPSVSNLTPITKNLGVSYLLAPLSSTEYCYCDVILQQFKYFRGSFKFLFIMLASLNHTIELVFYLASREGADWQLCPHQRVIVQGTTEWKTSVPYVFNSSVSDNVIGSPEKTGIYVRVLGWSQQTDTVTDPIYIVTYKACDKDMRVYEPRDISGLRVIPAPAQGLAETTPETGELQSYAAETFAESFEPLQKGMTGYEETGFVFGEEITHYSQVIKRYLPYGFITNKEIPVYDESYSSFETTSSNGIYYKIVKGLELYSSYFLFWRGSVNIRLVNTNYDKMIIMDSKARNVRGSTYMMNSPDCPTISANVPYYEKEYFQKTQITDTSTFVPRTLQVCYSTGAPILFKSAGDDFSLHHYFLPGNTNAGDSLDHLAAIFNS